MFFIFLICFYSNTKICIGGQQFQLFFLFFLFFFIFVYLLVVQYYNMYWGPTFQLFFYFFVFFLFFVILYSNTKICIGGQKFQLFFLFFFIFFIFLFFFICFIFCYVFYFFIFFLNPKLKKNGQHSPWPHRAGGCGFELMYPGQNHKTKGTCIISENCFFLRIFLAWLVFGAEFDSVHKLFHSHTFKFTFFFEYFLVEVVFF